jgi:hypothetical protein
VADGVAITPGAGANIATDDIGGFQYQRIKQMWGADGIANEVSVAKPLPVNCPNTYERVAASQTAQVLGTGVGGIGDYIAGMLIVPATTSPGAVALLDGATSMTVFTGGASSVSNLVPFYIPLGMVSQTGAWKVTTGANVSVIGMGAFS